MTRERVTSKALHLCAPGAPAPALRNQRRGISFTRHGGWRRQLQPGMGNIGLALPALIVHACFSFSGIWVLADVITGIITPTLILSFYWIAEKKPGCGFAS